MDKVLKNTAKNITNTNYSSYLLLGIFFCIACVIAFCLELLMDGLGVFTVVLLIIPFFFGTIMQAYALQIEKQLVFSHFWRISFSYYRPQFFGSFSLIKCFLKALLTELIAVIVFFAIFYFAYANVYGDAFLEAYQALDEFLNGYSGDFELLEDILEMNDQIMLNFIDSIGSLSSLVGAFFFIYGVTYSSIACYYRSSLKPENYSFNKSAVAVTIKNNRRKIAKDYWSLNWPLFILLIIGLCGGALISYFGFKTFTYSLVIGLSILFVLFIPYFPFYLGNSQALFLKYRDRIFGGISQTVRTVLNRVERMNGISNDQKDEIRNALKTLDEAEKNADDDNKKDPESGS